MVQVLTMRQKRNREIHVHGSKNCWFSRSKQEDESFNLKKRPVSCRLDTGVPGNFVMQLSGHKNVQSLSLYKSATLTHQQHNFWYFEQKIDE